MRHTTGNGRSAFLAYKGIICGLLFLVLLGAFSLASAESTGYFTGRVWNDIDDDGLMSGSEPGVEGVVLHLVREDNGDVYTATSDATGAYLFASLPNDSYAFSIEMPGSMVYARYRSEGGNLRSVFTGEETEITRSFIVRDSAPQANMNVGLVDSAIIRGLAFLDRNYNGNYDEGEPAYPNVAIEIIRNASDRSMGRVYTGADGTFSFNNIRTGNYRLRAIVPDDGSTFTRVPTAPGAFSNLLAAREGRRENSILSIDVENSMVYEYYVGVAIGGKITGTVFTDKNYTGVMEKSDGKLSGIKVQLVDAGGTVISETATGAKGVYAFLNVMPGEYTLRYQRRDGYTFTKYRPQEDSGNRALLMQNGGYGETNPFSFIMGETVSGMDAGMVQSAALSGIFFYDSNDNGLMDAGEGGFTEGTVRLVSQDGEIDLTQPVNADGSYTFSGVVPTEYTLYYLLPEHAEMARVAKGGNTLAHQGPENAVTDISLKANKSYTQPLVGAVKLGTFEGCAFTDRNANSMQDADETPLAGVTVSLVPQNGQDAQTATTGSDGLFSITGLRPQEYRLEIALPDGMIFAGDILASGISPAAADTYSATIPFVTLLNRASNCIGAVMPATLQASVWLDENRSGAQDAGERLLDGLEYTLYDETHQQYIMTARSGEDGVAVFRNVRPSTYTVSYTLPDGAQPVSGVGTFTQSGSSMRHTGIAIHSGDTYTAISGGVTCVTSIGGTVEADRSNGRRPVEGAQVRLYQENGTAPLQTTVTDAQGTYRFDGLWPGNYVIEVVRPAGLVFIRPNDPALQTDESIVKHISDEFGISDPITLFMAQDQLANRALLTIPAKVGTMVWLDENGNGLIDGGEPTINGVTVNLLQDGVIAYTTTSDAWGYYEFADVYPGEYTLKAVAYPALAIAKQVPELRIISSCLVSGDGTLAVSDPFSVTSDSVNFFYHLGYVLKTGKAMPPEITEGAHQLWLQSR